MQNILGIVAIIVTGVTLLFAILATALTQWTTYTIGKIDYSAGLWKVCGDDGQRSQCLDWSCT